MYVHRRNVLYMETTATRSHTSGSTQTPGGAMFQYHTTAELLQVNATYLAEYRADPTEAKLAAVNASSIALSERGA